MHCCTVTGIAIGEESSPKMIEVVTTRQLESHEVLYNQAATAMNDGDPKSCMKLLAKVDHNIFIQNSFLSLGYICAIAASHLDAADMLQERTGTGIYATIFAWTFTMHGCSRRQNKSKEALEVLTPEGWTTEKHKELGTTMLFCTQIYISGQRRGC